MMEKSNSNIGFVEKKDKFKLIIPDDVETKIREWCMLNPTTEWSGTLFYNTKGSFENNDIEFTVKDFFVSDVGTSGFTVYDVTPEICNYMLENDILDCNVGLIHSHNQMSAFFSQTDNDTLKSEGCDTCHYLSLVVNNAGKYVARVTRKIKESFVGKMVISYLTYGENTISSEEECAIDSKDVVEYYNLDIDIRSDSLKIREEILARYNELKKKGPTKRDVSSYTPSLFTNYKTYDYNKERNSKKSDHVFYGDKINKFDTFYDYPNFYNNKNDINEVFLNSKSIESLEIGTVDAVEMAAQILYGNITLTYDNFSKFTKVNSWIRSGMIDAFNKRFHASDNDNTSAIHSFDDFIYMFISTIINDYVEKNEDEFMLTYPDCNEQFESIVAKCVIDEIDSLVEDASKEGKFNNPYIDKIKENLNSYLS